MSNFTFLRFGFVEETEGSGSSKLGFDLMANANVRFKFGELSSKFGLFGWY